MRQKPEHIIKELQELAPDLEPMLQDDLEVPNGYWQQLESNILQQTIGKSGRRHVTRRMWGAGFSIAAAILLFVSIYWWQPEETILSFEEQIAAVSYEELLDILAEEDLHAESIMDAGMVNLDSVILEIDAGMMTASTKELGLDQSVVSAGNEDIFLEEMSEEEWLDLYEEGLGF